MAKLFIEPTPGSLGQIIDALRDKDFKVNVIGWGLPPIYVETEQNRIEEAREIAQEIDSKAKFSSYREDLIDIGKLPGLFTNTFADVTALQTFCFGLKVPFKLAPHGGENFASLALYVVQHFQREDNIPTLLEAFHKEYPRALEKLS